MGGCYFLEAVDAEGEIYVHDNLLWDDCGIIDISSDADEGGECMKDAMLLAPYAETCPGFEVLFGPSEHFAVDDANRYRVCIWNIWAKNDPAEQDVEKQRINAMEVALGSLDDETRYIRLQIACLQRCYYAFPHTVDAVLRGIGAGVVQLDTNVSCEPPWHGLRLILRQRRGMPPEAAANERHMLAYAYFTILNGWLASADLVWVKQILPMHAALAETIYQRLGLPDTAKSLQVQRLCTSLLIFAFPSLEPWDSRWDRHTYLMQMQTSLIDTGGREDKLGKLIDGNINRGTCHHSFFRHLDYQIGMIGTGVPIELDGKGEERRRIQDAVTNYVHAMGSWLAHRTPEEAINIWPPAEEIIGNVYAILGTETPVKRWLVALLWKRLQDNQAKHGRGALDTDPERFALPEGILSEPGFS